MPAVRVPRADLEADLARRMRAGWGGPLACPDAATLIDRADQQMGRRRSSGLHPLAEACGGITVVNGD